MQRLEQPHRVDVAAPGRAQALRLRLLVRAVPRRAAPLLTVAFIQQCFYLYIFLRF